MTGPVIFLACALTIWAVVCLDDWLRERREYERRVDECESLLAVLHERLAETKR